MKKVTYERKMNSNRISVSEVKDVFKELGYTLALKQEYQESSLRAFLDSFSKMDVPSASCIVQDVIANEGYIIGFAQSHWQKMAPRFPHRSEEEIKEKLMEVESIRVAVAILILIKNSSKQYTDWYFEPLAEYIKENDFTLYQDMLEATVNYIEKRFSKREKCSSLFDEI
jgi:DNA-directed RNA polymerase subunit F